MKTAQPLFDPATHFRIEVRDRVDVDWRQSFDGLAKICVDETRQMEDITVLNVDTDHSGIVRLVRRIYGLGITILQLKIVLDGGNASEVEEQC